MTERTGTPRPTDIQLHKMYALQCMGNVLGRFVGRQAEALNREIERDR